MASGTPLGISLGIDFSSLDAELSKVADRIEKVGKEASLKVGTFAGMAAKDPLDAGKMSEQVAQVGMALSRGMASGMRVSGALLLSFGAQINAVLTNMSGMMTTMFNRIDVAMKGHRWTNMLTGLSNALGNFASGSGKALSPLDKAMGGAFGQIAKRASAVFNTMFENLGRTMTAAMDKSALAMTKAMAGAAKSIETSMKVSLSAISITVIELSRTLSTSMLKAIEQIAAKMTGLRVNAEGAVAGLKAAGAARPYVRELRPPPKEKPIVDVDAKIKPPSENALKNFFAGFKKMGTAEISEIFDSAAKMPLKPPKRNILEPATFLMRHPPPEDLEAKLPKPSTFKAFQSTMADALATTNKVVAGIKNIPTAFEAAVASGNKAAIAVALVGQAFYAVGEGIGFVVKGTARIAAGFAAMGLAAAAAIGRTISFFTTLGSVGKTSFAEIAANHNVFVAGILMSSKLVYHLARGLWDLVTLRAFRRVGDDAKNFGSSVATATGMVGRLISSVGRLGTELAAALGVVGVMYKVVQFFRTGVKSAADLNAEVARSKVVFGESFGVVEEQAQKTTQAFKISHAAQLELASGFGSMAQGAGVSEEKSASLANELTSLAVDMTGLGISFTEASEAMKTGLSGRAISLKQFAVMIDENTTKAFAWKNGIASAGSELTNQQTLMARAGQIMQGLSYAQGALAANAGQAAVQFQRAGGGLAVFGERIGELLLPAIQELATGFDQLMSAILTATEGSITTIQSWAAWIKEVFSALGIAVRNAGDLWQIAQLHVNDFVTNALAYLFTLPENLDRIWKWIVRNWQTMLIDMFNLAKAFGTNLATNFMNLGTAIWEYLKGGEFKFEFTDLLKDFKAASEQLPELLKPNIVSSEKEIAAAYNRIGEKEQKLKEDAAKPITGAKMAPMEEAGKGKEYKLGGALEAGTKEAFSAISKGMAGRTNTTDAVKQGVSVQKDQLAVAKEQLAVMKAGPKMSAITVK